MDLQFAAREEKLKQEADQIEQKSKSLDERIEKAAEKKTASLKWSYEKRYKLMKQSLEEENEDIWRILEYFVILTIITTILLMIKNKIWLQDIKSLYRSIRNGVVWGCTSVYHITERVLVAMGSDNYSMNMIISDISVGCTVILAILLLLLLIFGMLYYMNMKKILQGIWIPGVISFLITIYVGDIVAEQIHLHTFWTGVLSFMILLIVKVLIGFGNHRDR